MRKRKNPFFTGRNPSRVMLTTSDLMPKRSRTFTVLSFVALAVIVLSGAYFLLFSPTFLVTNVTIAGTERIGRDEVLSKITQILNEPTKSPLHKNHILFLPESEILSALKKDFYNIDTVTLDRTLPNSLKVSIHERTPVIVWQQSNTRFYVDRKGIIVQRVSLNDSGPTIPLVTNTVTNVALPEPGDYVVHPEAIERILTTKNLLQPKIGVDAKTFTIPTGFAEEFTVQTSEGWGIVFDRKRSVQSQIDALATMLTGAIKDKRPFLHYVDLRVKDVGYFQ